MDRSQLGDRLLARIRERTRHPVSDSVAAALRACPPHVFVPGSVDAEGNCRDPSCELVLDTLVALEVERGHAALEIGAGSGWTAALLGQLVGPEGAVTAVEIVPEVAASAARALASWPWVSVVAGDGSEGWPGGPYDRVVFAASATDLPPALYAQVAFGGRVALPLEVAPGLDALLVLERTLDGFESLEVRACHAPPLAGHGAPRVPASTVDEVLGEAGVCGEPSPSAFPLATDDPREFAWRTAPFRLLLALSEPGYRAVAGDGEGFAIVERGSAAICTAGRLERWGTPRAERKIRRALRRWALLGLPSEGDWRVSVRQGRGRGRYQLRRTDSTFTWRPGR